MTSSYIFCNAELGDMRFHLNIRGLQRYIFSNRTSSIYYEAEINICFIFISHRRRILSSSAAVPSAFLVQRMAGGGECAIFTFHVRHWNQKCANLALIYNNELNIPFLLFFVTKGIFVSNETRSLKQFVAKLA